MRSEMNSASPEGGPLPWLRAGESVRKLGLMIAWRALVMLAGVGWLAAGCGERPLSAGAGAGQLAAVSTADLPTRAQPRLRTMKLFVGPTSLTAELALTASQIQTGMMFRTNVAANEGMLFVFAVPHRAAFWMKNVTVPLSCAYVDPAGTILEIHDMVPGEEKPIQAGSDRVQYVLETARGWFETAGVKPGMPVTTEQGTLRETFQSGRGGR